MTGKTLEETLDQLLENYYQQLGDELPTQVYNMVISKVERTLLKSMLAYTKNNQSKAAKYLGLSRGTLRKKLREYDLDND